MESMRVEIKAVLLLGLLQLTVCFVHLDTAPPPESPTEGYLEHVSLDLLTAKHLGQLSSDITYLRISNSKFEGIHKHAFDHLTHLNALEISDCQMEQDLDPQTLSRLPGLETLVLRHVGLRRVRLNLTNVQEVVLAENELEAFDGRAVDGSNVNFLDLSSNKIKLLSGSFANMSKLSTIDISRNKLREIPPVFQQNVRLRRILASTNKLTSTEGLRLPWLRSLDLFANEIQVLDSESFSKMTSLEELTLSFNHIVDIRDAFKDLLELKDLNLAWNNIDRLNASLFRNNLYLTKLSLQGNKITSLEKFQNVHPHLTDLDVSHNQLSRLDNDFFLSVPSLRILDLSFNRLKALDNSLSPLAELKILNLAFNHIQMTGNELSTNHQLTRVNLSSNGLQRGLTHFRNNVQLQELDLSQNGISRFCEGNVVLKALLKVNLRGNEIESLGCLKDFPALCQLDLRDNPLACGEELDGLILGLSRRRGAPYKLTHEVHTDLLSDQCEHLSLNTSVSLWNSVKRELCPKGADVEPETAEEWESAEETAEEGQEPAAESFETKEAPTPLLQPKPHKMGFIHVPLGVIQNDEMNKPNPIENPQSGRLSWGNIDEHSELMNGFEDEEVEKRPRFSWYTIALILIGLSLTLTCFNLFVFLYIRLKVWKRAESSSPQKYTALHNEVYKNTTEPSKCAGEEWQVENGTRNKVFAYGRINEILLNFGLNKKDKDSESVKNILIHSSKDLQNL